MSAEEPTTTPEVPATQVTTEKDQKPKPEEDNTIKVFAGNLSFATNAEDLKTVFNTKNNVVNSVIISRWGRSLGYGFVSFNTQEDADGAVAEFNKVEVDGRPMNVELAKPKSALPPRKPRGPKRGPKTRKPKSEGSAARIDGEVEKEEEVISGEESGEKGGKTGGRRKKSGPRPKRKGRKTKKPIDENAETSETMLFVANLPWKVTDEDLKAIFRDYQIVSAKVVRLRSGQSKGFGFVEVSSKEEQDKVLSELKDLVVDGRELVVRVAMASQVAPKDEEKKSDGEVEVGVEEITAGVAEVSVEAVAEE